MSLTLTKNIPLGFKAPEFLLPDVVSQKLLGFDQLKGSKGTVVMFICNHCPYVVHLREGMLRLASDYITKGIGFVVISSNDVENYPQDGPQKMKELAEEYDFPFPYLYDETQDVARAYDAVCTPDFSVFDDSDCCVYRGEFDSSRPGNDVPVTGQAIRTVFDLLLEGKTVPSAGQVPSMGCNIKWKQHAI